MTEPESWLDAPVGQGALALGRGVEGSPRLIVDVWMAVPAPAGWRVLLLRRTPGRGGFWQGVSGRVEAFDATLADAAQRELREETGIEGVDRLLDLGRWIEFTSPFSGWRFKKRSLGALLPRGVAPAAVRLSEEHDRARLVSFAEARRLVRFAENVEELSAFEARLPRGPGGGGRSS